MVKLTKRWSEIINKMTEKPESISEGHSNLVGLSQAHLPYGTFYGDANALNLLDANIDIVDFGTNEAELSWLEKITLASENCGFKYEKSLAEVASGILKNETTFDLDNYQLYVSAEGARGAMAAIGNKLITKERPFVAYGSPNWVFEKVVFSMGGIPFPYYAPDANSFVDGFEVISGNKNVAALIVVDPSNPLGYRLEKKHVERIEEIANKNGTAVIFDDVFRGLQAKGNRHSSSEYSKSSIIVETTSKRFSAMGRGVTWSLVPKSLGLESITLGIPCGGCSANAALITDAFYSSEVDVKLANHLEQGKKAYVAGMAATFPESLTLGRISQAFPGMPFFNYFLPWKEGTSIKNKVTSLPVISSSGGVTPGMDWIGLVRLGKKMHKEILPEEIGLGCSYVRICPTKEPLHVLHFAGGIMGFMAKNAAGLLTDAEKAEISRISQG